MNILAKIGDWVKVHQKDVFLVFCMISISVISYNMGKIGALKKTPVTIIEGQEQKADVYSATGVKNTAAKSSAAPILDKRVVVSKNSDKYHFTWCSGAKRIKEENKIWFATREAAAYGVIAVLTALVAGWRPPARLLHRAHRRRNALAALPRRHGMVRGRLVGLMSRASGRPGVGGVRAL